MKPRWEKGLALLTSGKRVPRGGKPLAAKTAETADLVRNPLPQACNVVAAEVRASLAAASSLLIFSRRNLLASFFARACSARLFSFLIFPFTIKRLTRLAPLRLLRNKNAIRHKSPTLRSLWAKPYQVLVCAACTAYTCWT